MIPPWPNLDQIEKSFYQSLYSTIQVSLGIMPNKMDSSFLRWWNNFNWKLHVTAFTVKYLDGMEIMTQRVLSWTIYNGIEKTYADADRNNGTFKSNNSFERLFGLFTEFNLMDFCPQVSNTTN